MSSASTSISDRAEAAARLISPILHWHYVATNWHEAVTGCCWLLTD